jgi:biopolymer transport protein TolR
MTDLSSGARRRTMRVAPDINVTPLVDVVLVLLIIFMVVAPHMDQDIDVTLPGMFNPDPEVEGAKEPLTISMTKDGTLYIETTQYDIDSAVQFLQKLREEEPQRRLSLRADTAAPYSKVRDVFARLREIGFPGTNLGVGHRAGNQPGVPHTDPPAGADGAAAPPADPGAPAPAQG